MLAIFDWDGTLCDSLEQIVISLRAAALELGLPEPAPAAARAVIGLGLHEALATLFPAIDLATVERLRAAYRQHHGHPDRLPDRLYPGAADCLTQLRRAGVALAVATGKSRSGLERALRETGLEGWFDATCTAEETASKPDPAMLHKILSELRFERERAIVIGDTSFDLQMAAAAGVASVAVTYGAHPLVRLQACGPAAWFDRLDALAPWILARR